MSAVWWACDQKYLRECRHTLSELNHNVTVGKLYITKLVFAVVDSYTALDRSEEVVTRIRGL